MNFQDFKAHKLKDGAKRIGGDVTDIKGFADVISMEMKSAGRPESEHDIEKNMEAKAALYERKANEIMHTANTGYGAELVPGKILTTDFIDLIPQASPLMNFFMAGYHGKTLPMKVDVPVLGELPLHTLKAEQTTGAFAFAQGL